MGKKRSQNRNSSIKQNPVASTNGQKANKSNKANEKAMSSKDNSEISRSSSATASCHNDFDLSLEPPQLTQSDYNLLLKNSFYDEKTINEWFEYFIKDCPDGKLKKDQLSEAFLQSFGEKKRNQFVSTAYRVFDPDNRGYINFVSFLIALSVASQCIFEDKFKLVFTFFNDKIKDAAMSNRLMKDLTSILQVIYDFVDENNRSGTRSPKSRAQQVFKTCVNSKIPQKKLTASDLLEACLQDEILVEVAKKCIISV